MWADRCNKDSGNFRVHERASSRKLYYDQHMIPVDLVSVLTEYAVEPVGVAIVRPSA